jgi:hypothetical protein
MDFGEAYVMSLLFHGGRGSKMSVVSVPSDPGKPQTASLRPTWKPRQMRIALESSESRGLSESERAKVLAHLAGLLLLAAGVVSAEEEVDEP